MKISNYHNQTIGLCLLSLIFYITACSNPQPENKWQYDAVLMSEKHKKHFLQDNLIAARLDLNHARKFASRSAELRTLIDIELQACAMKIASLEVDQCERAAELLSLQSNDSQNAYLNLLLSKISTETIEYLPTQYQSFAEVFIGGDKILINKSLAKIRPLTSRLIASSLYKESIDDINIQELIDELSYRGYKRPLLAWLNQQMQREEDSQERERLRAKIQVLTSH